MDCYLTGVLESVKEVDSQVIDFLMSVGFDLKLMKEDNLEMLKRELISGFFLNSLLLVKLMLHR
jgi:hypothetical protein